MVVFAKLGKRLFIFYLIVAFLSACSPRYNIKEVVPTGNVLQDSDGRYYQVIQDENLSVKAIYDGYQDRGFNFTWKVDNRNSDNVNFTLGDFNCSLSDGAETLSIGAYNPANPNSKYSARPQEKNNIGEAIITVIGIVLVVGLIFLLLSKDRDKNENNDDGNDVYVDNSDTHIHNQTTNIYVYNQDSDGGVETQEVLVGKNSYSESEIDVKSETDLNNELLVREISISPGESSTVSVRCPLAPWSDDSSLSIQAYIGGKLYSQRFRVVREEVTERAREHRVSL